MKKLLLLLFSSIILFSSCNDDDPKPDPLIGTWEFRFVKLQVLNNPQAADTLDGNITAIYWSQGTAQRIQLEIKSDNTFEETYYLIDGTKDSVEGKWKKGTDSFTLTYDDTANELNYTIQNNDEEALELVSTDDTSFTDNGVTFEIKATTYYEK